MFLLVALLVFPDLAAGSLDPSRFHCVDFEETTGNFLMRSNMPIASNASGVLLPDDFAYAEILDLAPERAVEECGAAEGVLDDGFFLVEVTLNNAFDDSEGLVAVRAWHSEPDHFSLGRLVEWPIGVAGIVPPAVVDPAKRPSVAEHMFVVDQLPQRVAMLRELLTMPSPVPEKPMVVLVHCVS